jgi:MFS transporter, NHS family, xanthosine permease
MKSSNILLRLITANFLQLFVWGAWLTTLASYGFGFKHWSGQEFGIVFSTLGIASIIMPPISGIIADKYINLEKLYGLHHIMYAIVLLFLPLVDSPSVFFWVLLLAMFFYMPTLSLSNSLSYRVLSNYGYDVVKVYPYIRVFGTIGFIAAMWLTNLVSDTSTQFNLGLIVGKKITSFTGQAVACNQFYIASFFSLVLGLFSFTLPTCEPQKKTNDTHQTLFQKLGFDTFRLFENKQLAIFFIFSMLIGAALQLTNMYGETYIKDFGQFPEFADTFAVKYANIVLSISQISETLFIITIPFFLKRFGVKKVMLLSILAWVFRFGFFAFGNPLDLFWMLILSNIVYGLAFDFFNISGSLYIETNTQSTNKAAAQGLFMMMTNGFGAIIGSILSGFAIDRFFTSQNGKDWQGIWISFACYALILLFTFAILFQPKKEQKQAF